MEDMTVQDNTPPVGKSFRFKLAFIGLALINFVFQFDATALGVALPVMCILREINHCDDC